MAQEFTKDQLWKLYSHLPDELKDAIFSVETADHISNACQKNGLEGDKMSGVAKYTGQILMGIKPPDSLQALLEKELKIKKEASKNIAQEINRFVFYPINQTLAALHGKPTAPFHHPAGIIKPAPKEPLETDLKKNTISDQEEKPLARAPQPKKESLGPDSYRETVE